MTTFLAQRVVRFFAVLLTISVVSFFFLGLIPGNPVQILLGEHATRSDVARITQQLQLDKPWYVRLGAYLAQVAHGDLGTSLADHVPVAKKLMTSFPATIELALAAMLVAIVIGIPAGVLAAVHHRKPIDAIVSTLALAGISIPVFWLGWMLLYVLAYEPTKAGIDLFPVGGRLSIRYDVPVHTHFVTIDALLAGDWPAFGDALAHLCLPAYEPTKAGIDLFPVGGRLSIRYDVPVHTHFVTIDALLAGDWPAFGDALAHLCLPAITLGTIPMAIIAKMTRAGMLEVLRADYLRTARAKGLGAFAVVVKHGLRNALVPIVTVVGLQTGLLLGGAVLTESIFSWPGVGRLAFEAISNRDYPLIDGCILLFATTFVVVNLAVDLLYAALDPRIRYV